MADTTSGIIINTTGDTAAMATDYGTDGSGFTAHHVPHSKLAWGGTTETNRVTLETPLPIKFAGTTGAIEVTGFINGVTTGQFPVVNKLIESGSTAQYLVVGGSTGGDPVGITGAIQGFTGSYPVGVCGDVRINQVVDIQGTTYAGKTANVAVGDNTEVYGVDFGFGVPIAVTAGRRLNSATDSVTISGSINATGGRELAAATDSVSVYGYDGTQYLQSVVVATGPTYIGASGDSLKVAVTNAGLTFTVDVATTHGVTNDIGTTDSEAVDGALKVQGITGGAPVMIKGTNGGAVEIVSSASLDTTVSGTVTIDDSNITDSLESTTKPLISRLSDIKTGTDNIQTISQDLLSGRIQATINSITKPTNLRAGSKTLQSGAAAGQLHNNLEIKSGVTIKSAPSNNLNIMVGSRTLVGSQESGYTLEPGESIFLDINNLNRIFVKIDSNAGTGTAVVQYIGS